MEQLKKLISESVSSEQLYFLIFSISGLGLLFYPSLLEARSLPVALSAGLLLIIFRPIRPGDLGACGKQWCFFLVYAGCSAFWSMTPGLTMRSASLLFLGTAVFLTSRRLLGRTRQRIEILILAITALISILAIYQWGWGFESLGRQLAADPSIVYEPFRTAIDKKRAFGTFATPGALGALLILLIPTSVRLLEKRKGMKRFFLWILFAILLAGLVVNQSVGAGLSLLFATLIYFITAGRKRSAWILGWGGLAIMVGLVAWRGWDHWFQSAFGARLILWERAFQLFLAHPVVGCGLGSFDVVYRSAGFTTEGGARFPHQLILQWMVELGATGTLLGLLAVVLFLRRIRWETGLWIGPVSFFAFGMVDLPFQMPELILPFAFLLGGVRVRKQFDPHFLQVRDEFLEWGLLVMLFAGGLFPPYRPANLAFLSVAVWCAAALSSSSPLALPLGFVGGAVFFLTRAFCSPSASGAVRFIEVVGLAGAFGIFLYSRSDPQRFIRRFLFLTVPWMALMWARSISDPSGPERWTGFVNPKHFALFVLMAAFGWCYEKNKWVQRVLLIAAIATLLRLKATAAFFGGAVALAVRLGKKRAGWAVLVLLLIGGGAMSWRVTLSSSTQWDRCQIWKASWKCSLSNPLWGRGPGVFAQEYHRLKEPREGGATRYLMDARYAHNEWLDLWVAFGAIGLMLVLGFLWFLLKKPSDKSSIAAGLGVASCFDFYFRSPLLAMETVAILRPNRLNRKCSLSWGNGFLALGLAMGLWGGSAWAERDLVSARQAESSGRFEEALDCYERAQNLNPWDVRKARATALFLEKLYLSTGDMAWRTRSDDVWEKVCDLEPLDGDLAFEKARRETERVVVERTALSLRSAAESWKVARTALPFSAEVCEAEGDFWKRSGRVDSALESFGDGLRLEPRWARLWVEKGDLMKLRDPRGAKECYRMALRIHEAWKDRPLDSSEAFYVVLDPEIFKEATRGAEL